MREEDLDEYLRASSDWANRWDPGTEERRLIMLMEHYAILKRFNPDIEPWHEFRCKY